ncbi:MAG: methenyltetrahydromethanopterin cyclohydrolase [Spirochaetales bacterium]|nr:methenyltetrahydromethanopterin cyclohydrolase [Spirochaetales bacterium]
MISINKHSMRLVNQIMDNVEALGCRYYRLANGAHVIDMGIEVPGGWEAAKLFTEIDMAGLGTCGFRDFPLDEKISVPVVEVFIDNVQLACMGSQMAGLQLAQGEFSVIASGPARAKARAEGDFHVQPLDYRDDHHQAILGITANSLPDEAFAEKAAEVCKVKPENLYLLMHSYNCIVCTVQVSARIVEQTINQMMLNKFDTGQLVTARGYCAVAPLAPDDLTSMGWVNDCLLYGGKAIFWVRSSDEEIREVIPKLVTESAADYGRLFVEMFEEAGRDFYAMDLSIHSPAEVQIVNLNTGNVFSAGSIRRDILKKSFFKI